MLNIIAEAIKEAGPKGIPGGYLYAAICDKVDAMAFAKAIHILENNGIIEQRMNLLIWKSN